MTDLHKTIARDLKGLLVEETRGNSSTFISFHYVKLVQSIPPRKKSIYLIARRKAKGLTIAGMHQDPAPQT